MWEQPKAISGLDMAFGPKNINDLLPRWEQIPDEFKRGSGNKWVNIVGQWFFRGLKGATFTPKAGIDQRKALAHIGACLGSFEPKHEHKEAGCAYLLSLWFDDVKLPS